VPAIKNLGKSNLQVGAARQLLDDVSHARQLAISQRTTVYMVFVPQVVNWWNYLPAAQQAAGTNLLDKQCSGYTFVSLRSVGDQPGQGVARYLAEWKSLPDGAFIATNKFYWGYTYNINQYSNSTVVATYQINTFNYTNLFPFPTETNSVYLGGVAPLLPFIAFNYLGQLTVDGQSLAPADQYIPLAQGTIGYAKDLNKNLLVGPADFTENPPGNSTNSMFSVIQVDRLTGRATLRQQKVQ